MERYIGQTIEIIYLGDNGQITQRQIEVKSVSAGIIKARCLLKNSPRLFKVENILAIQSVERKTS